MYKIGQEVEIVKLSDDTINKKFLHMRGQIVSLVQHDPGAISDNPLYTINFHGNAETESFWEEEIKPC